MIAAVQHQRQHIRTCIPARFLFGNSFLFSTTAYFTVWYGTPVSFSGTAYFTAWCGRTVPILTAKSNAATATNATIPATPAAAGASTGVQTKAARVPRKA